MFHVPEKFRIVMGRAASNASYGNNGAFRWASILPRRELYAIASDGMGWDHVSVHAAQGNQTMTPLWDEMCHVKNLFWDREDIVIQYHPAEKDYVNVHPHTLHLWRPTQEGIIIPTPPLIMV